MITILENWDLSHPTIPKRSLIPHIKPIGLGGPEVESLLSYLTRISDILRIKNAVLIEVLFAELKNHYRSNFEVFRQIGVFYPDTTLSLRHGWFSKAISICEALEYISDIKFASLMTTNLTQQAYSRLIKLRDDKAWCPYCYQDWKDKNQVVYTPLIWSFERVRACTIHKAYLLSICPYCQGVSRDDKFISPGYCANCGAWLGQKQGRASRHSSRSPIHSREKWQYESVGKILSRSEFYKTSTTERRRGVSAFQQYLKIFCDSDISRLSNEVNLSREDIIAILNKTKRLSLDDIISICWPRRLDVCMFFFENKLVPLKTICSCADLP